MIMQKHDKDCLQASLSELLKIDYSEIPEFYKLYPNVDDFSNAIDEWLTERGYFRVLIASKYNPDEGNIAFPLVSLKEYKCIGILEKSYRDYSHAVVLEVKDNRCILHDPKPDSDYDLRDLISIEFILPIMKENT